MLLDPSFHCIDDTKSWIYESCVLVEAEMNTSQIPHPVTLTSFSTLDYSRKRNFETLG